MCDILSLALRLILAILPITRTSSYRLVIFEFLAWTRRGILARRTELPLHFWYSFGQFLGRVPLWSSYGYGVFRRFLRSFDRRLATVLLSREKFPSEEEIRASLFFFFLKLERFVCTAQQTRRKSGCSCFNTVHGTNDRSIDRYDTAAKGSVFRGIPRGSDKIRRDDSTRMWTRGGARHDAVGDAVLGDAATRHEDFRAHRASAHWTRRGRWSRSCPCPRAERSPRPACRGQPASSSSPRCRRLRPAPPRSFVSSDTRSPVHKQTR